MVQMALIPEDRAALHQRIGERFLQMLDQGLVAEVEHLRARGDLDLTMPSMRCVGYRQVWEYLDGMYDYGAMVARAQAATRQLAKRQLTWLRGWPDLYRLPAESRNLTQAVLKIVDRAHHIVADCVEANRSEQHHERW